MEHNRKLFSTYLVLSIMNFLSFAALGSFGSYSDYEKIKHPGESFIKLISKEDHPK